jgi:hypothetical protein
MITELLDSAILEVGCNHLFELTGFQLGSYPMNIFIEECKEMMGIPVKAEIANITNYKGIKISEHPSSDAVMYSIQLKSK